MKTRENFIWALVMYDWLFCRLFRVLLN